MGRLAPCPRRAWQPSPRRGQPSAAQTCGLPADAHADAALTGPWLAALTQGGPRSADAQGSGHIAEPLYARPLRLTRPERQKSQGVSTDDAGEEAADPKPQPGGCEASREP